jgi:DNA-binding transcriptional LysR family regulator
LEQLEEPEALRRLRSGDLDLAVVYRVRGLSEKGRKQPDEGFDDIYLADDPYRVVLPPAHPLASRRELRPSSRFRRRIKMSPYDRFATFSRFDPSTQRGSGRQVPSAAHMVRYLTDTARTAVLRSLIAPNPTMSLLALRSRT